ncbi:MAG: LysM peptidoglycan-binding domain-containing protein [Pseudonocardiaceae bacterium]
MVQQAREGLAASGAEISLAFAAASPVDLQDFDFLFPTLQADPANLLPESTQTVAHLKALAATMEDLDELDGDNDSPIPAAYTYFAQFVDHDITFEVQPADLPPSASGSVAELVADNMAPMSLQEIQNAIRNFRTGTLDLDSLYGLPAPRDPKNGAKMRLGEVFSLGGNEKPLLRPPGKDDDNDLPREPPSGDILHDRAALIGDPRNDENLIVAQLHLAFLKAHNRLVDEGRTFEQARRILRQHYQHIVIHDFLPRVADPDIVEAIVKYGNRWYNALAEPFFMPLEFAVAAYRFGHTMVRARYNFNLNFNLSRPPEDQASVEALFTFTALSGEIAGLNTVPDNWIIEWENIIGDGAEVNKARRLDTLLAAVGGLALFNLQTPEGEREPGLAAHLSARNLLRGYRMRMPTGQAVANHLGLPVLTPEQLQAAAGNAKQLQALNDGGFADRTPLWFYVLAEAKYCGGTRLGPVGSTIVAEVLIGLVRRSDDSILRTPGWVPSLPAATPGTFELADLLRFAGVLPAGAAPPTPMPTYVVRPGDNLTKIAREQLGDGNRWPEIFALNRNIIRHPDRIFPGQTLILPSGPATQPPPRFYIVRPGDNLTKIAREQLGDGNRWPEIFALNGDVISNPNVIVVGQVLLLPTG